MPIVGGPRPPPTPLRGPASPGDPAASTGVQGPDSGSPVDAAKPRKEPDEVYAAINPEYTRPSHAMGTSFGGYHWKADDLDAVMRQYAVGDAKALIRTAIALDQGDRYLSVDELKAAAQKLTRYVTRGHKWSPSTLADILQQRGLAEETALLRAAKRHDNGDRFLDRAELERAADVLTGIVKANDIDEVQRRIDRCVDQPGVSVEKLGEIDGHPVRAVHFGHTGPSAEPKLRVVVTGGVHGNEPCGTGAAMLLLEQLLKDPKLCEEVSFTVVPLMNPRGYEAGHRRTPGDTDLNRHFYVEDHDPDPSHRPAEVEMLEGLLEKKPFDLAIDLHSGYASRDGFWVYHRNAAELAKPAMARFAEEFPALNPANTDKPMLAPGVVVESDPLPPGQPHKGTLKDFAIDYGAKWSFTVEAPGSVSYLDQVMGENEIVHHLLLEARLTKHREDPPVVG